VIEVAAGDVAERSKASFVPGDDPDQPDALRVGDLDRQGGHRRNCPESGLLHRISHTPAVTSA
jgi:hypothetical protein